MSHPAAMPDPARPAQSTEMVFGLAGPIGVDIDAIVDTLGQALQAVDYRPQSIRLTREMAAYTSAPAADEADFYASSRQRMELGNRICQHMQDNAALGRIGLQAIRAMRRSLTGSEDTPAPGVAYIIRQFKRPQEVDLFRRVYGRRFVLVSAYGAVEQRRALLEDRLRRTRSTTIRGSALRQMADELIEDDASDNRPFGQRLRDTFHRGDVFIDGLSRMAMSDKLTRFVQAIYGRADIAPSRIEFGMYAAHAAALRSTDLSRQVGAAIFSEDGDLIAQGCNEVPKAFGGAYWDSEEPDFRDVRIGHDPNAAEIREVLRDLVQRLRDEGMLSQKALDLGTPSEAVRALTDAGGILADASVLDLTEYGRVVHAEMAAICDAARLGRSVKGGVLFCTTFPCHNCTKHILAAGIRRVIYIEPYPKSRAKSLHANEIEVDGESATRVVFAPFMGISPVRYRDIFQKGRRKQADGRAQQWYPGDAPRPMIESEFPAYLPVERFEVQTLAAIRCSGEKT